MAGQKSIFLSTMNRYVNWYMAPTINPGIRHSSDARNVNTLITRKASSVGAKAVERLKQIPNFRSTRHQLANAGDMEARHQRTVEH